MEGEVQTVVTVTPQLSGTRLDQALDSLVEGPSKALLQKLVRRGRVRIDGKRVLRSNVRVQRGQKLEVQLEEATPPEIPIRYEDEHLLVVEKPAGILTHPTERHVRGTLAQALELRFGSLPTLAGVDRPGVVHRLDRETSGLIVIARTDAAMRGLQNAFRHRRVAKTYFALVYGAPSAERFTADRALGPQPGHKDRQAALAPPEGKEARTSFEVGERLGDVTLVVCRPETGRRHQIRVHLADLGLPLVGDEMYRGRADVRDLPAYAPIPKRHALHAAGIAFDHPVTGVRIDLDSPLPPDLARLVAWLREKDEGHG